MTSRRWRLHTLVWARSQLLRPNGGNHATESDAPVIRFYALSQKRDASSSWKPVDLHPADDHTAGPRNMDQPSGGGSIGAFVERLPHYCRCLAFVWSAES